MYLRGIVSFGAKRCGERGVPGVYTNVFTYIKWIKEHLQWKMYKGILISKLNTDWLVAPSLIVLVLTKMDVLWCIIIHWYVSKHENNKWIWNLYILEYWFFILFFIWHEVHLYRTFLFILTHLIIILINLIKIHLYISLVIYHCIKMKRNIGLILIII